jgi:hypothetical protein
MTNRDRDGRIQHRDSEYHNTAFYTCTIIKNMAIISIIKYTHTNTVAHQVLLHESVKNKNKCKLYKCMQEAKWFIHTLTHPCKLFFFLAFILYLVEVIA